MAPLLVPLQSALPGGTERAFILVIAFILFVVPIVAAIQIYRDASVHDVDSPVAWSLGMLVVGFLGNILGVIAVWILYTAVEVRE